MSGFIRHLVSNHINPTGNVLPRLKGTFETFSSFQQSVPGNFGEEHIETGIANDYNSLHQSNENSNTNLSSGTNKIISGNEKTNVESAINLSKEDQQTNNEPVSIYSNISNTQTHQQVGQENETNDLNFFTPQLNTNNFLSTPLINDALKKVSDESNQRSKETKSRNENFLEENREAHLLIPDTKNAAGNFNTIQQYPSNEQNNVEKPKQTPDYSNQQLNMAIVNAFRLMQNKNAAENNAAQEPTQVIKVNIGRIDVRAVIQQAPARQAVRPQPTMSLNDFLNKEKGSKL